MNKNYEKRLLRTLNGQLADTNDDHQHFTDSQTPISSVNINILIINLFYDEFI